MIERKILIAELARGGFIRAERIVPFPHAYHLVYHTGFGHEELEESTVQRLVDMKIIAGKPVDALWDVIDYRVTDARKIEGEALTYWKKGFGWCAKCDNVMHADAKNCAPRHGHTHAVKFRRADGSEGVTTPAEPPCEGSGQPMIRVVRPLVVEVSDAA